MPKFLQINWSIRLVSVSLIGLLYVFDLFVLCIALEHIPDLIAVDIHNLSTLQIICPIMIWIVLLFFFASICFATYEGILSLRKLHRIPCNHCAFYTGDHRLKCTVHPCTAFSIDSLDCIDYEPKSRTYSPAFSLNTDFFDPLRPKLKSVKSRLKGPSSVKPLTFKEPSPLTKD
jgi:hypothetical protein